VANADSKKMRLISPIDKEKGACNCLAKPFTPEQLRNAINQAVGSKSLQ
jgi:hypothetical protein